MRKIVFLLLFTLIYGCSYSNIGLNEVNNKPEEKLNKYENSLNLQENVAYEITEKGIISYKIENSSGKKIVKLEDVNNQQINNFNKILNEINIYNEINEDFNDLNLKKSKFYDMVINFKNDFLNLIQK